MTHSLGPVDGPVENAQVFDRVTFRLTGLPVDVPELRVEVNVVEAGAVVGAVHGAVGGDVAQVIIVL